MKNRALMNSFGSPLLARAPTRLSLTEFLVSTVVTLVTCAIFYLLMQISITRVGNISLLSVLDYSFVLLALLSYLLLCFIKTSDHRLKDRLWLSNIVFLPLVIFSAIFANPLLGVF
jgi:hypothetical protein